MKHLLLTTIAAVVLVGCGSEPNYSGNYTLGPAGEQLAVELKPDGSFIGTPQDKPDEHAIGSWEVEGDLLVCEGTTTEKRPEKIVIKFNKTTLKVISISINGREAPIEQKIPEGADGYYLNKN